MGKIIPIFLFLKTIYNKRKSMDINTEHPAFIKFADTTIGNISSNVDLKNYFTLTKEKKKQVQKIILKLLLTSFKTKGKFTDEQFKTFTSYILDRTVLTEEYEISGVLKDIITNYENINKPKNNVLLNQSSKTSTSETSLKKT